MRTTQRRIDPGLIGQLLREPQRFEFFQAVRLLELHFRRRSAVSGAGAQVISERVRFRNSLELGFPPSQIEAIEVRHEAAEAEDGAGPPARDDAALGQVTIIPRFMGLLGANGALPIHYTESIAEREQYRRDRAARAFLDLFTNRAVGLFYQAWKKYRMPLQFESDRRNRFLPQLLSFGGLGLAALRERMCTGPGAVDDEAIAFIAGLVNQRPVSAATLQCVLAHYFDVPIRIEQFVGRWYVLSPAQRSSIGGCNVHLGRTALVGERVWQRDLRLRIWIGPLDWRMHGQFLPGGERAAALGKLLTLLTGTQFEYEVRPILRACDVKPARLVRTEPVRLGFDAFVCSRAVRHDRSDTLFELHPIQ